MTASHSKLFCVCVCVFMMASIIGPANVPAKDNGNSSVSHDSNSVIAKDSFSTGINEGGGGGPLQGDTDGDGIQDDDERDDPYISRRFSFEYDSENWIAQGLWERSEMLSFSPKTSYHCRREIGSPDNFLTSPSMDMPNVDMSEINRLQVTFWYFAEFFPNPLEYGVLQINDGSGWSNLKVYDSTGPSQSMPFDTVDITSYAGQSVQLRFNYHQLQINSPLLGWYIDEVRIVGYTNPDNPDTDADKLGTDEAMYDGNELDVSRTSLRFSFERHEQGWTHAPSGTWERTTDESKSRSHSFHTIRDDTQTTTGTLTSPEIKLPMSPSVTLKFSYLLDAFSADLGKVGVKVIGGGGHWEDPVYKTEMGNSPFALCVGDADNDGDNDIVVQADPYYVYIYKWEGDDWADPIVRGVGGSARQIFIGDADNDGYNDIVVTTGGYYGITILRWNGVDDWEDLFLPGTGDPYGVFVADADYDGDNDIVTSDYGLNTVSILPWEGSDWGTWFSIPVGYLPIAVFVADIDGDNDNDIAVANQGDDTVTILEFPGWTPETLAVGDYPNSIFVNDVDDDGDMDIVTPNYFDDTVSILEQRPGLGWFRDDRDVGTHPASVFVEDVDEDGDNDIVVSDQHSHTISILRWGGSDWNPRETLDVSQYPAGIFIADADNDGDNDIVNTNLLPGSVSIFKWTGNPNFLRSYTIVENTAVWTDESLDISEFADDYVQIVFQYTSFQDGGVTEDGWYIDDVIIEANTNPLNGDTDADERNDGLEAGEDWESQKYTYEAGDEGWEKVIEPNLWERTSSRSNSPSYSFHCGRDSAVGVGSHLWTPWFRLPLTDNLLLDFQFWWEPISGDSAKLSLEVYGGNWNTLWSHSGSDPIGWTQTDPIDVSQYGGEKVRLLLYHDSVAGPSSYEGWYVDDLIITGTTNPVQKYTDAESVSDGEETITSYKLRMYSFEYDSEGWTVSDYWKQLAWIGSTDRAHSPDYSMHIGHNGEAQTSVLASPVMRLPLSTTLTLRFWHWRDGGVCVDWARIYLSISGRETYAVFLRSFDLTTPFDWTEESISLSDWGDEIVQLKIYYKSKTCGNPSLYEGWYIDDVVIEANSNPLKVDTDEDGFSDYKEIDATYERASYDFDEETDDWEVQPGSLWERTTSRSNSPSYSFHCGRETGQLTFNELISVPISLPMSTELEVSFWFWWDPMTLPPDYGHLKIQVPSRNWDNIADFYPNDPDKETWTKKTIDISGYAGEVVHFMFFLASNAGVESVWEGLYVDDFRISGTTNPVTNDTDEDGIGEYSEKYGFKSGKVVMASGFTYKTSPVNWDTDSDGAADGHDPVPLDWDMDGDGTPNDADSNMDGDDEPNSVDLDDDNDGMSDEYENKYGVAGTEIGGGGWQSPTVHNRRYALLVTGVGDGADDFPAFWNDIKSVRSKLMGYSFDSSDVYVLGGFDTTDERDGVPLYGPSTREIFFRFFDEVRTKITENDLLFIVVTTHAGAGLTSHTVLKDDATFGSTIMFEETARVIRGDLFVDVGISQHWDAYHTRKMPVGFGRMVYLMQGCYAGVVAPTLSGKDRIIIMSSEDGELSYTQIVGIGETENVHFAFLYQGSKYTPPNPFPERHSGFSLEMGSKDNPKSIKHAFDKGYTAAINNIVVGGFDDVSHPQLDDNNNGLTEEDGDTLDGDLSEKTYI